MRWPWLLAAVLAGCTAQPPAADLAHGRRLAAIGGCISCHGAKLDGHTVEEDPRFAVIWSANLSRILPTLSDAQVERVLRTGRRPDGRALWLMPTFAHAAWSADDMRDLIAWMRTVPATGTDHPPIVPGPGFRAAQAQGMQDSATQAKRLAHRAPANVAPALAHGRYLARIACSECHGPELAGVPGGGPGMPPDIAAAAGYDLAQFRTLMRTGRGIGGRDLGDMTRYGPDRLVGLTDAEIEAIHAYARARATARR